jgi:hypothetical protein
MARHTKDAVSVGDVAHATEPLPAKARSAESVSEKPADAEEAELQRMIEEEEAGKAKAPKRR